MRKVHSHLSTVTGECALYQHVPGTMPDPGAKMVSEVNSAPRQPRVQQGKHKLVMSSNLTWSGTWRF